MNRKILTATALLLLATATGARAQSSLENGQDQERGGVNINDYRVDNKVKPQVAPSNPKIASKPVVTTSSVPRASLKGKMLAFPTAAAGAMVGVTVGVPVRIARDVAHETLRMRDQITSDAAGDEKPDMFARFIGNYTGMAYGLVSGVIKGSIKGTERGLDAGVRKPFSKESVSLKDPD